MEQMSINPKIVKSICDYTRWLTKREAISEDEALDVLFCIAKTTSLFVFGYMPESEYKPFLDQLISFGFSKEDLETSIVKCLCHPIFIQYKARSSFMRQNSAF